jgi:hypothetical protein
VKASHVAVGVVGLALAGLWYFAGGSGPPPAQAAEQLRVSDPLAHDNLTVYFVHGPDAIDDSRVVSLQEALERGWAVVHETDNVNTLAVENRSPDHELFVQSGDLIRGGKQDRMIATDLLLPANSGQVPLPVHCVESGRMRQRGAEAATHFSKSDNSAAGKALKIANASGDQTAVWNEVRGNQQKLNENLKANVNCPESPTSFQLSLETPVVKGKVADFEQALLAAGEGRPGVVGVVFVVNGKVSGFEVYASNGLFKKAWPKLLRAASVEALTEEQPKGCPASPSAQEVEVFLASACKTQSAAAQPAVAINGEEPEVQFRGRSGATGNRMVQATGGRAVQGALNEVNQTEGRAVAQTEGQAGAQPANPAPSLNPSTPQLARPVVRMSTRGNLAPEPTPQAARPSSGNRLSVNRVENPSAVMIESRDPAKPSAVIHRSYIAK